jgi:hypothetical protein
MDISGAVQMFFAGEKAASCLVILNPMPEGPDESGKPELDHLGPTGLTQISRRPAIQFGTHDVSLARPTLMTCHSQSPIIYPPLETGNKD